MKEVLSVIMGGGRGTRLYPLTKVRAKPAVPVFGRYRLIDIAVSNCLNSQFNKIYILTQFNSESLNKHISKSYKLDPFSKGFVEIMTAEQSMDNTNWFQGTADAVRRCLKHFNDPSYRYILILSGDQLYKMDFRDMLQFHVEKEAEITIACNPVNPVEVSHFGIMGIGGENRIVKFLEKPKGSSPIKDMLVEEGGRKYFLGSMGIYLFNKETLVDILKNSPKTDFGKEIIPDSFSHKKTLAYVFHGYWRDIGTIKSFYNENLALTENLPPLDMFNEDWLFFTRPRYLPPAKINSSHIVKSIVSEGAIVQTGAKIRHSVIGLRSRININSIVEDSIIMGADYYENLDVIRYNRSKGIPLLGVGENCVVKRAIIDKNVRIGNNVRIINRNNVREFDGENYYVKDGIIIVEKNATIPPGTVI